LENVNRSNYSASLTIFERFSLFASKNWIFLFALIFGIYVFLPFFAPLFMLMGLDGLGNAIYKVYSFLCHQLPQRSYYFFGPKISYSIPEIQAAWKDTFDPMVLRQFVGNPQMGWKVAWSDRMVSMYGSTWLFGLLWWPLRKRLKPLPWWELFLFLLPMSIDGTSHLISDLYGIGQGFRDSNVWLVGLTGNMLPPAFYAGDAWGSFNAWMRLITGVFFGIGIVWFGFPYLDQAFEDAKMSLQERMKRLDAWQSRLDEQYQMLIRIAQEGEEK
jgi:uncharacterized membrane protein